MTGPRSKSDAAAAERDSGIKLREELEQRFRDCGLVRPFRRDRYEPGHRLELGVTGVLPANTGRMVVEIDRFVGGGFAGQVYRVKLLDLEENDGPISGLEAGRYYAIKILKPPSRFSCIFRDFLYFLAYQGSFSAQVNPAAMRTGVLWQKLIRRAAAIEFENDEAVCNTFATFYDKEFSSFGEINEWVDGRIWKFEMDDRLFDRWNFKGQPPEDHNAPEFVHKKLFMKRLVALLHEMGAPELARQYEWWTCKSQPNVLKRTLDDGSPAKGLCAIDFRAGLTLLPFLPMSPVDFRLILRGLFRGRIVQFDRSDPIRFRRFIDARRADFKDLQPAIEELEQQEAVYRASMPDVTHHGFRLITDAGLRRSIKTGTITNWKNLGRLDKEHAERLEKGRGLFAFFYVLSFVPLLGKFFLKLFGNAVTRAHMKQCLTSAGYLWRTFRGSRIEALVVWHRRGRASDARTLSLVRRPVCFWVQRIFLGLLPAKWHRSIAEPRYAWSRIREMVSFTVRFLRVPAFREECLLEQVQAGRQDGMLTEAEADRIVGQIKDPFIQKYLRCLAVHVCTVPITQIVMFLAGGGVVFYCLVYRQLSWAESMGYGTATAAAIQLLPISPGSIARGLFVLYMMIRERDIRNYYIAAPVSFIHVIGYLAFPLQMAAHHPALARFLAGRWTKNMVHIVPVFGENGGLLEHGVFDFFFNLPLSVKRGVKTNPMGWAAGTVVITGALALFAILGYSRAWEWSRPKLQFEATTVTSIVPSSTENGDLHLTARGVEVRFEGHDTPVAYPAEIWDASVRVGDLIDAVIRESFFSDAYDGLEIARRGVLPGNNSE